MTELCFCPKSRQPRIFFTFCFLFSFIIVTISIVFFYYPDGLGLSTGTGGFNFERSTHFGISKFRDKMSSEDELRRGIASFDKMDVEGESGAIGDYGEMDYSSMSFDSDGDDEKGTEKIRHYLHHHGRQKVLSLEELQQKSWMSNVIETRLLHLDMKGAPPKVSYLKEVMKLAKQAGITGLMIEWEDTFPWKNTLSNLTLEKGGYTLEEVEDIINFAERAMGFEVIPLVQTFGHAEFILKGPDYRDLREVDGDPQSFCPSKSGTLILVKEMIDQVLEVHKNAKFLHIGCDEVFNIRVCPICTSTSDYRDDIFLKHVTEVATYVKSQGKIAIIWDDMLRLVPLKKLNESGIGSLVEPMVWVYAEDVDRFVGWEAWEKYREVFSTLWGAGSFKGAFGETLTIPPISRHADNVERWVGVINRESPKWSQGVGGIVLTGWMRYDHFSVLCELLPASIPSLVYNSLVVSVPATTVRSIKNRIFVPKSQPIESTTAKPSTSSAASSSIAPSESSSEEMPIPTELRISKRSPQLKRKIPHPRILMNKDRLAGMAKYSSHGLIPSRGENGDEVYDKYDKISKDFCRILHCPNYHTRLDALIKGSDGELSFATRCNFPGVAFFRVIFRIRSILHETWEAVARIQRKRGWVTQFNVRHNYSLPLRVTEVVMSEAPRLRRQLEVVVKSVETSLKPIFGQEVILEWIEQNLWEAWKALDELEKAGEILRNVNVWPRRPLNSPTAMIQDLKLFDSESPTEQEEL